MKLKPPVEKGPRFNPGTLFHIKNKDYVNITTCPKVNSIHVGGNFSKTDLLLLTEYINIDFLHIHTGHITYGVFLVLSGVLQNTMVLIPTWSFKHVVKEFIVKS